MQYQGLNFSITMDRALILYRKDLRYFQDTWDPGRNIYLEHEEVHTKFSFIKLNYDFWIKLLEYYRSFARSCLANMVLNPIT